MSFSLASQTIVVTGANGRIGPAIVARLAEADAKVVAIDLEFDKLRTSDSVDIYRGDVTSRGAMEIVLDDIGSPHGLVNLAALDIKPDHAGSAATAKPEDYPADVFDETMHVNVTGTLIPMQVFGGAMAKEGRGAIVNMSSIYGMVSPDQRLYQHKRDRGEEFYKPVAYAASKSALYNLTRYFATWWGPHGVRVNTLTLGGVAGDYDAEFLRKFVHKVPLGRMATAAEAADAVHMMLGLGYMTGANVVVDGGLTAW